MMSCSQPNLHYCWNCWWKAMVDKNTYDAMNKISYHYVNINNDNDNKNYVGEHVVV